MIKKFLLVAIQILIFFNTAFAGQNSMLSPRVYLGADQMKDVFHYGNIGNPLLLNQLEALPLQIKLDIDNVLDLGFKDFTRKQEYYYKTYMQIRGLIFDAGIDQNCVLNYLRSLSQNEDLVKRKFYLMVWAKLMEDYITDNLSEEDSIKTPNYITLCLTERCNAKCRFCLAKVNPEHKEKLSIPQIKKILLDAKLSGIKEIRFMGGELSLVREELLATVRMARGLGLKTGLMFTNGWWIDEPWAEEFMLSLAQAEQKKSPTIMLSVDSVHQRHIALEKIGRFVDKYTTLFPGETVYLHTYITDKNDELDDLIKLLGDKIVKDEMGTRVRFINLKQGKIKVLYVNLLQIGDAENLPQDLYDRFVLKGHSASLGDAHFNAIKFTPSISTKRNENSLTISARGEYFLDAMYIPDNIFSMTNIQTRTIDEAVQYMQRNKVIRTLFEKNGHFILYEKAKEFVPDLFAKINKCNFVEEALVQILRDPIARLGINIRLLEDKQIDSLNTRGLISRDNIDIEYILKIAKENKEFLSVVDNSDSHVKMGLKRFNQTAPKIVNFAEQSI